MPAVEIRIAGADETDRIVFAQTSFESAVNGRVGRARVMVRDLEGSYSVTPGADLELLIDGAPVWTGFVTIFKRGYVFPAINVADFGLARFFWIEAADLNILFEKRIVYTVADPTDVFGKLYGPDTPDNTVIADLVADYLDLSGDGLDVSTKVEHVASINVDQEARAWSGGYTWGQAMASIAMLPGAVYFIEPARFLVYTDVNTANAPYAMSDQPTAGQAGYREMAITKDGTGLANDVLAWGMGFGSRDPVFTRLEDAPSLAQHNRWQQATVRPGIFTQATIDRVAESIVDGSPSDQRGSKDDKVSVRVVTYVPGFLPAQKVDFTSAVFGFNDVIPIRSMRVTFDSPTDPKYELVLSHEIDSPWGFFDQYLPNLQLPEFRWPKLPRLPVCDCDIDDFNREVGPDHWGTASSGRVWSPATQVAPNSAYVAGAMGTLSRLQPPAEFTHPIQVYTGVGSLAVAYSQLAVGQRMAVFWAIKGSPSTSYTVTTDVAQSVTTASNGLLLSPIQTFVRRTNNLDTWSYNFSSTAPTSIFVAVVLPGGRYNFTTGGLLTHDEREWYPNPTTSEVSVLVTGSAFNQAQTAPLSGRNSLSFVLAAGTAMTSGPMSFAFGESIADVFASDLHLGLAWLDENADPGHTRIINGTPYPTVHTPHLNDVFVGSGGTSLARALGFVSGGESFLSQQIEMPIPYDITLHCNGLGASPWMNFRLASPVGSGIQVEAQIEGTTLSIYDLLTPFPIVVDTGVSVTSAFRARFQVANDGSISGKVWAEGAPEPADWQITLTGYTFPAPEDNALRVQSDVMALTCIQTVNGSIFCQTASQTPALSISALDPSLVCATSGSSGEALVGSTTAVYPFAFVPGTALVWLNGIPQRAGVDFTETDPSNGAISLTSPIVLDDVLRICAKPNGNWIG